MKLYGFIESEKRFYYVQKTNGSSYGFGVGLNNV